uniref:Uncharacterized protein n=1 Tax=Macrostomum lignano TaxID=282301 RepID=A0A1I8FD70_9PLAT
MGGRHAKEVYP